MKEKLIKEIDGILELAKRISNHFQSVNEVEKFGVSLPPFVIDEMRSTFSLFYIRSVSALSKILDPSDSMFESFIKLEDDIKSMHELEGKTAIGIIKLVRENLENDVYSFSTRKRNISSSGLSDEERREIKRIISKNKIEDAFDRLMEIFEGHPKENDLIQLIRRYNKNKQDRHKDISANDNLQREENKIVNGLLELIK